jgi:hypothetical protein
VSTSDYIAIARSCSREEFVRRHPFYFLVGGQQPDRPTKPRGTMMLDATAIAEAAAAAAAGATSPKASTDGLIVFAVKKNQKVFDSMIMVGRTDNNDIVLGDALISRFHSFFKVQGDKVELGDAGSFNGTFIGDQRLVPKGPTAEVPVGSHLRFAHLAFDFVDAATAWDRIRAAP